MQSPAPLYVEPVQIGGISPLEESFEGVVNLIVRTTNPGYTGKVFGVMFQDGQAVVNRHTRNPNKYTLAQLATKFKTDLPGYIVYAEYADGRIEPPLPAEAERLADAGDGYLSPDQAAARQAVQRGRGAGKLTGKLKED